MNKALVFFVASFLSAALSLSAQPTQSGYVKTKGRLDSKGQLVPGARIGGATVQLTGGNSTISDANGNFKITAPDGKFFLRSVQKQGYVLTDPDILSKQYSLSSNPLVISMETPDKQLEDQLKSERKLRRTLQQQLQQREQEIDSLKENNLITAEEYRAALQKLYADQESNEKLIGDMAKRYAEVDYDLLDEFYRQVSFCIENGDLVKADSLLRSRGDVRQQVEEQMKKAAAIQKEEEKLQRAKATFAADNEELAHRCYSYFEKFSAEYQNDSAAYYLGLRAGLDTTNIGWQLETGQFASNYLGDYDLALKYYQTALQQALKQYGEESTWTATACYDIGGIHLLAGRHAQAKEYLERALNIRRRLLPENHPDMHASLNGAGMLASKEGDQEKAMTYYLEALQVSLACFGENHEETALIYNNIAQVYYNQRNFNEALEYHKKALAIREANSGGELRKVGESCHNIGSTYGQMGQTDSSLVYMLRAVEIFETCLGHEHPILAMSYNSLGVLSNKQGNPQKALEYYHRATAIWEKTLGPDHPNMALAYSNIGAIYYKEEDYDTALQYLQRALDIRERALGPEHPTTKKSREKVEQVRKQMADSTSDAPTETPR